MKVVESSRDRASERAGVRSILRLTARHPHHAVVHHEHVERHQHEESNADLNKDGTLLGAIDVL